FQQKETKVTKIVIWVCNSLCYLCFLLFVFLPKGNVVVLAFFCSIRSVLREANRAVELEGDDTYYAPAAEEVLAIIEAQTGETASAVARLPKLLKSHYFSWLSYAPLTPALL